MKRFLPKFKVAIILLMAMACFATEKPTILSQIDLFTGGDNGYNTYRIPAVVVSKGGTILVFCEGRKNSDSDFGDIDLLLKSSSDGGQTWTHQRVVCEEGGDAEIMIANPCPIADMVTGEIHLLFTSMTKRLLYTKSSDEGRTWEKPGDITNILKGFKYPIVRAATGPVHGIQLEGNRLVAPIWLNDKEVKDVNKNSPKSTYVAAVIFSDDHGKTWHTGGIVEPEINRLNESTVFEASDGSLIINMRAHAAGFRAIAKSTDGGITWTPPKLDKNLLCPTCQASTIRFKNKREESENIVLFSNPVVFYQGEYNAGSRNNLTIRLSYNDGQTWPVSRQLCAGPSGYSDLAVLPNGEIVCVYEAGTELYSEKIVFAKFSLKWITEQIEDKD